MFKEFRACVAQILGKKGPEKQDYFYIHKKKTLHDTIRKSEEHKSSCMAFTFLLHHAAPCGDAVWRCLKDQSPSAQIPPLLISKTS